MTYEIISTRRLRKRFQIKRPQDIWNFTKRYGNSEQEVFIVLTLNGSHEIIASYIASVGLANKTIVHPREVFKHAIRDSAVAIVVAHNHPSGKLFPSPEDDEVTDRIVKAGAILGIQVIDHLIINKVSFYSYREGGFNFSDTL